ncbi:hypothetical protein T07_1340 [Trichinella nelsoni]|uniref:Uncharacterized protein n=1 Tax=Trichinella nelsoni TaxID=6336 RepID=A0A0V0S8K2_9BILA|nr:hypothetical protein T07_1340 [Trichinella nelsoni]
MITECSLNFLPYPDPSGSDRHRQTLTQLVGRWATQMTTDGQQLIPLTDNNILAIVSISLWAVTGLLGLSSQHHFGQLSPIVRNIPRSMVVFQWFARFPLLDHRKQLTSCRRLYFVWTFSITIAPQLGRWAYPMTNWKWTKDEKITCSRGRLPCGRVTTFSPVVLFNIYMRRTLEVFSFAIVEPLLASLLCFQVVHFR